MTWNVSDINRRPPPLGEPTRAFLGDTDPLASKIITIARAEAERVQTDVVWALACLQNSVNVRRRA